MEQRDNCGERTIAHIEERAEGAAVITGYAATFYDGTPNTEFRLWDGAVERIMPGAFDNALARPDDVRALFNHSANHVLGRVAAGTMRLAVDATGLRYEIDMPDTTVGHDTMASVKRRDITGSSFKFTVDDEEWRREGAGEIRELRDVQLFDIGPVTYPAYESTSAAARSGDMSDAKFSHVAWQRDNEAQIARRNRARVVEISAHSGI
ncbi:MAG: HK97 family phage prohead protease [Candidatus Atribacteria bacterium]|nr:HK97 family phage prohead protease [Candidatus Atribacteria bacterium]